MKPDSQSLLGATYLGEGRCHFLVWAPHANRLDLKLIDAKRLLAMEANACGYYELTVDGVLPGTRYFYRIDDDRDRPDPASRFQPEGVHGPSQVIDGEYAWHDQSWHGLPLQQYVIYELHVGTYSDEATFAGVIQHLDELVELGVTAVGVMPIAQFPGTRNWGYDGTQPFAAQNSYGGPTELKRLVDACHERGLAVVLDVVYNHLGPEGNYLAEFGPYFTDRYHTPWGAALNFDSRHSDHVRRYFTENALYWIRDCHVDALRLDAVHAIFDESARPFLQELAAAVHREAECLNRRVYVIEESNKNDARHLRPVETGGWGLDAVWNDDFHHTVHALLTGEASGYYADFGRFDQLVKVFREGFAYTGEYAAYRGRRHGTSARDVPGKRFVISTQTHDQVGNRLGGERLSSLVSYEEAKLAAGLMLLSPYVPMLFMGEEYGETARFLYFVSHGDDDLIDAVRAGRKREFASFAWDGDIPDPQAKATFQSSRLNRTLRTEQVHQTLWEFYRELLRLRRNIPALAQLDKDAMQIESWSATKTMFVRRWHGSSEVCCVFHLSDEPAPIDVPLPAGQWTKLIDSADTRWNGSGGTLSEDIQAAGSTTWEMPANSLRAVTRSL